LKPPLSKNKNTFFLNDSGKFFEFINSTGNFKENALTNMHDNNVQIEPYGSQDLKQETTLLINVK